MKEVLPGIYQITLSLPEFTPDSVNVYLIKTADGYAIIDTGWDSPLSFQSMESQLAEIGAHFKDIKQIIITHGHIDHFGMIVRFKQSHPNTLYMPAGEMELIKIRFTGGDNILPLTDKFLQSHGVPQSELIPPDVILPVPLTLASTSPDVLLQGGEEIIVGEYKLKVINVPGHTPGHIALYEPRRKYLFSGDVLLPTTITNAAMHIQYIQDPFQQYLNSLCILKEMDIDKVLPGHEYIFSGHRQRIEKIFQRYAVKSREVHRALEDGQSKTAYDVSRILSISQRTGISNWPKLSGWDRRFAAMQSIAHLESLRFCHEVHLEIHDRIHYYSLLNAKSVRRV
jgi:glyoxylase-like metal-dependent hydrolase (beta-lactamase superfamily II)